VHQGASHSWTFSDQECNNSSNITTGVRGARCGEACGSMRTQVPESALTYPAQD
jgi:hypothetical protein